MARAHRLLAASRLHGIETFVQFAGFPRSGHSLIGSILDAHLQARVSHELDAMGLLEKGFSQATIFALMDKKACEFTRHGRYWNGYCYRVPNGHHDSVARLRVIGDKKGDAAVRRIARAPGLLDTLANERQVAKKWILVLRNPFDNIATMSLRHGRVYDELKTRVPSGEAFRRELEKQQANGFIPSRVLDSQIDDYASLCETVGRIKQATLPACWFELCHEDFVAHPGAVLAAVLGFLNLPGDDAYINNGCSLVHGSPNLSRHQLQWSDAQRARVRSLIHTYSFLSRYDEADGLCCA